MVDNDKLAVAIQQLIAALGPVPLQGTGYSAGGHPQYNMMPTGPQGMLNTLWGTARGFIAPVAANFFGIRGGMPLPYVPDNMSIGSAYYSSRITKPQWDRIASSARSMIQQETLNQLGISDNRFRGIAGVGIGAAINSPLAKTIYGGDPMAPYRAMFSSRMALGDMFASPFSKVNQEFMETSSADLASALSSKIRTGVAMNYQFTRGFDDSAIATIFRDRLQAGGLGDVRGNLLKAHKLDAQLGSDSTEHYTKALNEIVDSIGESIKTFDALAEIMGSRDMKELSTTLDKLAGKPHAKLSQSSVKALGERLRDLQAWSQVLDVDDKDMLNYATLLQTDMQKSAGLTSAHLLGGITGGGLASGAAAIDAMVSAAKIGKLTNNKDIMGIAARQQSIMTEALSSAAGRSTTMIQYLYESGAMSKSDYDAAMNIMMNGTVAQRGSLIDNVAASHFGSIAAGRRLMNDTEFMTRAREKISDDGGIMIRDVAKRGYLTEWGESVTRAGTKIELDASRDAMYDIGLAIDRDSMSAIIADQVFPINSSDPIERAAREVYDSAIARGRTHDDALNAANEYLRRSPAAAKEYDAIIAKQKRIEADYLSDHIKKHGGAGRDMVTIDRMMEDANLLGQLSEEDRKEYEQARRNRYDDPSGSRDTMERIFRSVASESQYGMYTTEKDYNAKLAASWNRAAGFRAKARELNQAPEHVLVAGRALTTALEEYNAAIASGDKDKINKARANLIELSQDDYIKGVYQDTITDINQAIVAGDTEGVKRITGELGQTMVAYDQQLHASGHVDIARQKAAEELRFTGESRWDSSVAIARRFMDVTGDHKGFVRAGLPQLLVAAGSGDKRALAQILGIDPDTVERYESPYEAEAKKLIKEAGLETESAAVDAARAYEKEVYDKLVAGDPSVTPEDYHNAAEQAKIAAQRYQEKYDALPEETKKKMSETGADILKDLQNAALDTEYERWYKDRDYISEEDRASIVSRQLKIGKIDGNVQVDGKVIDADTKAKIRDITGGLTDDGLKIDDSAFEFRQRMSEILSIAADPEKWDKLSDDQKETMTQILQSLPQEEQAVPVVKLDGPINIDGSLTIRDETKDPPSTAVGTMSA